MQSFIPTKRTLMGPGPSDVHDRILEAMARPTLGHLDPEFQRMMEELKGGLRALFKTENAMTFPVSAPGSAGMEMCFVNLIEPGDKVVVVKNGVFGERMRENVVRAGGEAVMVEFDWGTAPDVSKVAEVLAANSDTKILAFVHAETSTGVRADAAALCALAREHDCLTIVDAVTSLGGLPVEVDAWGIDAIYSGSQKCLSCTPGLSPVSFSERALARVRARKVPVQSWFLDLSLVMAYWDGTGGRSYHHTAPVNPLYGLHESLVMLFEEGLEESHARHAVMHEGLVAGLEDMGLDFLVHPDIRLPMLNAVKVPDGIDEAAVRAHLLQEYDLEIGAGLGPLAGKVWRIGLMGTSAREENVELCLTALADALGKQQMHVDGLKALEAARKAMSDD
ncbi:pyridoxal-phosphate-dependent aminotransferase family protein [Kordiimonas lacus]|uniref:Alanine-glyoxylate transaminase / serine-glyoxylate transaminase / serine-pyruvate transaminase n=1 Tax=Kordiimonas lacus TaxID=637679 RepID=A0A1G6YAB9_9PROT|nr:alanine--glyoxylate aminotransferase family protein [Kordiimonas lacus]SDD87444.1 alanine-glyoxylate transaminase / serine-glyoxylate transaminase / serine-pyruvate transaminase [Kordiimonas lacus]